MVTSVRVGEPLGEGVWLDGGNIPRPLTVIHGRADVTTQPDPPTCEFEWWDVTPPVGLGDMVQIWDDVHYLPAVYDDPVATYDSASSVYDSTADGAVAVQHYEGRVAGIQATGYAGQVQTWLISTVGPLARWGDIPVKVTRPAETDVARVNAIASAAGALGGLVIDGPAGVTMAAGDIDTDALSAVHDVCTSSGGLFWQARNGDIHYTTAGYRPANQEPDFAIPPHVIVDLVEWDQQVEDIINQVVIAYGPAATRAETVVNDVPSQAEPWGVRSVNVDTGLNALADASNLGALIVGRRAWPYWRSITATAVFNQELESLFTTADVNTVVMLPIPREPGPTPLVDPTPWVVEGWVEEWTEGLEHTAALAVSDQRRWVTTTLRTYNDILAMGTYADVVGVGNTYLDILVKEA